MSRSSDDWKQFLDEDASNELIRFSYAKALLDEKKWALAAEQFQLLVKHQNDFALAWAFLAKALCRLKRFDECREACEIGLRHTRAQNHQVPEDEILAVMEELDGEF